MTTEHLPTARNTGHACRWCRGRVGGVGGVARGGERGAEAGGGCAGGEGAPDTLSPGPICA